MAVETLVQAHEQELETAKVNARGKLFAKPYVFQVLKEIKRRNGAVSASELRSQSRELFKQAARRLRRIGSLLHPDPLGGYHRSVKEQYVQAPEQLGAIDAAEARVRDIELGFAENLAWIDSGKGSLTDFLNREVSSAHATFRGRSQAEAAAKSLYESIEEVLGDHVNPHSRFHITLNEEQLARLVYMQKKIEKSLSRDEGRKVNFLDFVQMLEQGSYNKAVLLKALSSLCVTEESRRAACYEDKYGPLDEILACTFDQWMLIESKPPDGCFPYISTPTEFILKLITELNISEDDVICDVGCGAGKVLLLFGLLTKAKVMGIEYDEQLAAQAEEALNRFSVEKAADAAVINADALDPELDLSQPTIFFLFTPFDDPELAEAFASRLAEEGAKREILVCSLYRFSETLYDLPDSFERVNFEDFLTGVDIFRSIVRD